MADEASACPQEVVAPEPAMIDGAEVRGVLPVPLAGSEAAARASDDSSPTVEGPATAEAAFEAVAVCAPAHQQPPQSSDSGVKAEDRGPSTRPASAGGEMGTESGDQGEDEQRRLEESEEGGSDGGVQDIGLGMAYALLAISKSAPAPDHEASNEDEPPSPTVRRKRTASQKVLRMSLLTESDDMRKKGKRTAGGNRAAKDGRKPGSKGRSSKAPKAANSRAAKAAARVATARQQREVAPDVKPKTKRSVRATAATTAAQRSKSEGASGGDSQQTSPRAAAAKANSQRRNDRAAQRSEEASEPPAAAGSLNIYCTRNALCPPVV